MAITKFSSETGVSDFLVCREQVRVERFCGQRTIRADQRWCVGVWIFRTRVRGQLSSVDAQSDVESTLGGTLQIRTIDLREALLETILGDGSEGRSLKREIQDGLVLRGSPQVEDNSIKVSTGHLDRSETSTSKKAIRLVIIEFEDLASFGSLSIT